MQLYLCIYEESWRLKGYKVVSVDHPGQKHKANAGDNQQLFQGSCDKTRVLDKSGW